MSQSSRALAAHDNNVMALTMAVGLVRAFIAVAVEWRCYR